MLWVTAGHRARTRIVLLLSSMLTERDYTFCSLVSLRATNGRLEDSRAN